MATAQVDAAAEPLASIRDVIDAMDEAYARLAKALEKVTTLPEDGGEGEGNGNYWGVRRVLSHIIGAWQRVPVHAAFYLAAREGEAPIVPIQVTDDYWIPEWDSAPIEAFRAALRAAYLGNLHFVAELDRAALARVGDTPFGTWTLGKLLMVSYEAHINKAHTAQLEALLR
ncbi:MAG TPA: hypothetical protein VFR15_17750 [Chloroflexia bacterium]|nr:hypothetical protein [Chloroflexia bacterium]